MTQALNNVTSLGIIPARAADILSEQDWINLSGRPLLDYTAEAALSAQRLSRVIVSTDSREIADHAIQLGLEAPFLRPKDLTEPGVPLVQVIQHCLTWLRTEQDYYADVVVLLEVSHPIRPVGLIDKILESLLDQDLDTVFTAWETRNVFWTIDDHSGELRPVESQENTTRSVRRKLYGQLTGLASATRSEVIETGRFIGERVGIVPVRGLAGLVDIQEDDGLELAEFLFKKRKSEEWQI